MSSTEPAKSPPPNALLPHQSQLIESILDPAGKRITVLTGDVGLGKTAALVALAGRLLTDRPVARVLYLTPLPMRSMVVEMLRNQGTSAFSLDRYRFRELLDSENTGDFWPPGNVVVVNREFARQADISDQLAASDWELLIVDEAHLFRGLGAKLLARLGSRAEKILLASAIAPDYSLFGVTRNEVGLVRWRRDQIVDQNGLPLGPVALPLLHEVPYQLSPEELNLRNSVEDFVKEHGGRSGHRDMRGFVVVRSLDSSPSALERVLLRMQEGYALAETFADTDDSVLVDSLSDEADEKTDVTLVEFTSFPDEQKAATQILQNLETISEDSKLNALVGLLNAIHETEYSFRKTCIITDFLATLFYLAAAIEEIDILCQHLHGGMNASDRQQSIVTFLKSDGILLATTGMMNEGLDLREVSDLILYDIPPGKMTLEQVLGRFDRFGRTGKLRVSVLVPSNIREGLILERLTVLRERLKPNNDA